MQAATVKRYGRPRANLVLTLGWQTVATSNAMSQLSGRFNHGNAATYTSNIRPATETTTSVSALQCPQR